MGQVQAALDRCRTYLPSSGEEAEQVLEPTRQRKKFNPFFQPNNQATAENKFLQKFKFISNYQDRFMGRCSVVQELETNDLYLMKQTEYSSDAKCREQVELLKNKKLNQQGQVGLLRMIEVYGKRVDGLFRNVSKCYQVLQYPLLSLKKEYNNRLLKNIDFNTTQIADVIFCAIPAYSFLEKTGCKNNKIRLAHIFVGLQQKQSRVKVIDSDLLQIQSNFECIKKKGLESAENQDIYLAPEEFTAFMEGKEPPLEYQHKAAVFSLGATILDLSIMSSSGKIYEYYNKKMNPSQVKGLINIARKRHGLLIYKLLAHMLEFDPFKRPTFAQLQILIQKAAMSQSELGSQLRLSTVKDMMNQYITTTRHSRSSIGYGKVSQASLMMMSMTDRQFCRGVQQAMQEQQQLVHMHEQYTNGNQYIGQKKLDLKHGRGKYIFKDHSYYQGGWKDDMMHGEGMLFFPNGRIEYQGQWAFDQPNGWGVLYAPPDGRSRGKWVRYQGQMLNGQMHGRGKVIFIDGVIYQGEFQNGKIMGRGAKIDPNGQAIQQQWPLQTIDQFFSQNHKEHPLDFLPGPPPF